MLLYVTSLHFGVALCFYVPLVPHMGWVASNNYTNPGERIKAYISTVL